MSSNPISAQCSADAYEKICRRTNVFGLSGGVV